MNSIEVIGTGSTGNSYLLTVGKEQLLLDLGVREMGIKKALGFDIRNLKGAVVSHSHLDHCKSEENVKHMGIPILAPYHGDLAAKTAKFGGFKVQGFHLPHDVPNYGFFIRHDDFCMVYATDFEYIAYNFSNQRLNAILIECNHIDENLDASEQKYEHVVRGHASLTVVKDFLKVNQTDALQTVILCHANALEDTDRMTREVQEVVGDAVHVYMAEKNRLYALKDGEK